MNSLLFHVHRTRTQVRLIAVESFNQADGTYIPLNKRHPDAQHANMIMNMLQLVASKMNPHRVDAAKLVEAAEPFMRNSNFAITLLPARGKLPARILVKDAV